MAHYQTGSGYASRPGLSARQPLFGAPTSSNGGQTDQMAINIESGTAYDLDEDIQDLRKSVGRLKQVSMAIQEENQLTRQIMEGLESAMGVAKETMQHTMKRLQRVARKTRSNHLLYVFLFGIVLFFTFYFWTKVYRLIRWFF